VSRRLCVEGFGDRFAFNAVSWCDRYAKSISCSGFSSAKPGCIHTGRSLVAGIRRGGRIPSSQLLGEGTVGDGPRPSAVADAGEFSFHFSSGSQTSKAICDSLVGAITPATRQKKGRLAIGLVEPAA